MSTEIEKLVLRIAGDAKLLISELAVAEKATQGFAVKTAAAMASAGASMQAVGMKMSMYVTAPIVGGVAASLIAFGRFENAMVNSTAIMGDLSDEMRQSMEELAFELSENSVQSSKELADSYYFLASAGLSAEASLKALPVVAKFATAGHFDMAMATDLLTDAQSALGLAYKDPIKNQREMILLSDQLVRAATLANTSVQQVAESLTNDAATASVEFGMETATVLALLDKYGDKGKKGAEAGNLLGRATRLLAGAFQKNGEMFKTYGIKVIDEATGEYRNFIDILADMEGAFDGLTGPQRAAALEQLGFATLAQKSITPLLGEAEALRVYEAELRNAGGTTEDVANKQLKSFAAQMKILWNMVVNVAGEIGAKLAPMITALAEKIKSAVTWWRSLSTAWQDGLIITALVAAAIGPIVLATGTLLVASAALLKVYMFMTKVETILAAKRIIRTVATWAQVAATVALKFAMMAIPFALFLAGAAMVIKWAMSIHAAHEDVKELNKQLDRRNELNKKAEELRKSELAGQKTDLGEMKDPAAKVKALEAAIKKSARNMNDLASNATYANKQAEKLAPTGWSLWQAGKDVYEEQLNKAKDMETRLQLEREHREKLKEMLEAEKQAIEEKATAAAGGGVTAAVIMNETNALNDLNAKLKEQEATVGMTASEIEVYRATVKEASEEQIAALTVIQEENDAMLESIKIKEEAEEAEEKRKETYKQMVEALDESIDTLNMTTAETLAYTAAQEGLTDIEQMIIKVKAEKLEAMKEEQKMMKEGEALTKAMRKPAEVFEDGQEKLNKMLTSGAIDLETYARAMEKLEKDTQIKVSFKISGVDAVAAGSLEAMQRLTSFRKLAKDPNKVDFKEQGQNILDEPKRVAAEGEAIGAMWQEAAHQSNVAQMQTPVNTNTPGLGFASGLTYGDLPGGNYSGGGLGGESEAEIETRDSNEIIAENTGKMVDAFGNIETAGL